MMPVLTGWLARTAVLCLYLAGLAAAAILAPIGRRAARRPRRRDGRRLLVLATFYNRNWCISHLAPLAKAEGVERVYAIVTGPTAPIDGVEFVAVSPWLARIGGRALAKLWTAAGLARRVRPEVVMGYHLVPGGITALLIARLSGARAAYQLTGGPVELIGGGSGCENVLLRRMGRPSRLLEALALRLARRFDLLVVRGREASRFLAERGLGGSVEIIPGSIDVRRFADGNGPRPLDLVSVGRLAPIKQPFQMIEIVVALRARFPGVRAAFLGDGPLLEEMRDRVAAAGLGDAIELPGQVDDVESYLHRARCFLLTSQSEGLSIALAEAMAAGVVPVVADVGELRDLVEHGRTGRLVPPNDIRGYADFLAELLGSSEAWNAMSVAARVAAGRHNGVDSVAARWAAALAAVGDNRRSPRADKEMPAAGRTARMVVSRRKLWDMTPARVKRMISPVAELAPPRLWLGRAFREQLEFVRSADRWSMEQLRAFQLERLQRLCALAYERAPYYRRTFEAAGFHPRDLRRLEDVEKLPTIDKNVIREQGAALCTTSPDAPGVEYTSTGGTGGTPMGFWIGTRRSAIEFAYLVAGWMRVGYHVDMPQAVIRGQIVAEDGRGLRHAYDPILRRHAYSNFHMTDENMGRYLDHMASIGPCFLHVYPSSAAALARYVIASGRRPPDNVRGILAGSESVFPDDRALCERAFGVRYYSWYGHTEKLVMAAECEQSTDYHVFPTYGYYELIDEDGRRVTTPGRRGEIVGTGFINSVMPFIRYRTGDQATFVSDSCGACGRNHPVIRDIRGHRTHEMLVAADGSQISWTALNMHDRTFDHVRQFQFVQSQPGRATLRIVPGGGFSKDALGRIRQSMERKLDGRVTFDIQLCDEIPLTPRGKSIYVDQRIASAVPRQEAVTP